MIAAAPKLRTSLVAREELSPAVREQMFSLLNRCFDGVARNLFEADLMEKNWVILLSDDRNLAGFTTLHAYEIDHDGERLNVIYSGDTIVAPEAWGTSALPRSWIHAVNRVLSGMSGRRSFWLLLSSGFRTYRFLPLFWKEFYPTYQRPVPECSHRLMSTLARARFAHRFRDGIVRFDQPQRLRGRLGEVPEERLADPHVSYFVERNPGHGQGDELVCLTELNPGNLTPAGLRMSRTNGYLL